MISLIGGGIVTGISLAAILSMFPVAKPQNISDLLSVPRASAFEVSQTGYNHLIPPNLEELKPYESGYIDASRKIPGRETFVQRYRLPDGTIVAKASVNGRVYAYGFNTGNPQTSYGLRDAHGDSIFREKYGHRESFSVPDWLVNIVNGQNN